MTEKEKELINAAKLIREHCEETRCDDDCKCPFDLEDGTCGIGVILYPDGWEIPEIRKFSDDEIGFAAIMKNVGAVIASKRETMVYFFDEDNIEIGSVDGLFDNLEKYTSTTIDEIIAEGEKE